MIRISGEGCLVSQCPGGPFQETTTESLKIGSVPVCRVRVVGSEFGRELVEVSQSFAALSAGDKLEGDV